MSPVTWWILAGSVVVGLIIMAVAAFITWRRIRKIRNQYIAQMTEQEKLTNAKAYERENYGTILHKLKPEGAVVTSDVEMEFAFNTFFRNGYKTSVIKNFEHDYESQSMKEIVKAKIVDENENYDFALVNTNGKIYEQIKKIYRNLNEKGIILVVNAPKKSKEIKTLRNELKLLGYRHEWQDVAKGVILIAK